MDKKLTNARKLFSRKVLSAIAWTIGFEFALSALVISFLYSHLRSPVVWLSNILNVFGSLNTWLQFSLIVTFTAAHSVLYSESFGRVSKCKNNRFSYLCSFVSFRNLFIICTGSSLGIIQAWFYTSLPDGKYNSATIQCSLVNGVCLAEDKLFIILNSLFIGLWTSTTEFTSRSHYIHYPVVQQSKFLQSRTVFLSLWKKSMIKAIVPSSVFLLIYLWNRGTLLTFFTNTFDLVEDDVSWYELLSLNLIIFCWLMATIFICTMLMLKFMFNLHLTVCNYFPIILCNNNADQITLSEAMSLKEFPVVHNLGYLDFMLVAQKDYDRRQQLFVLSQPGGHPYNWNGVVNECLELISQFTEELHKANLDLFTDKNLTRIELVKLKEPTASTSYVSNHNTAMRNLSMSRLVDDSIMHTTEPLTMPITQYSVVEFVKAFWFQILDTASKKPVVGYIFSPIPEINVQFVLSQSQSIIWATQGISFLTAASFKEDSYGISLKDLPAIVTTLVKLKTVLDKLPKFGQTKRLYKNSVHNKLETALRAAVKRSLYKICITYGEHLNEAQLSRETLQELNNYITS